ncbi:MAG: GlsB/YeaQ/YmgE family stress response membrane protein [Thermoleophilia bacterium]
MGIFSWIVIGLLAGLAARFVTKRHVGLIVTVLVGIAGAIVGGWVLTAVSHGPGLTGFSLRSFLVAFAGAVVLLFVQGRVSGRGRRWGH